MKKEAIIIGYSGHAYVLIDVLMANKYSIYGYCEAQKKDFNPYSLSYVGNENTETDLLRKYDVFLGIGSNSLRSEIFEQLFKKGIKFPNIIHPNTIISPSSSIGNATVIMPSVVINALCKIGQGVICNTTSVIEHECIIDNFAHIAPGVVLAGKVSVGKNTFVGANSVVKQGIKIGSDVIVGAGSVVINDIPDGCIVYGNPAKPRI
jgi:sugar O-acyltransferase (sialic acid O-acetyltransferase NeuD family)